MSNRPLSDLPELHALATRIEVYHLDVTDAEISALMRKLASDGHRFQIGDVVATIAPEECHQVTEYLLKECRSAGCPLDLRLQQKAFQSYLQHVADHSVTHWQDMVAASVREAHCHFKHEPNTNSPEAKKKHRRNVVRQIAVREPNNTTQQEKLYVAETGSSRADFYRRKREVESGEFDDTDTL